MKKIITGYFFRLFRSFEFWALMVLFLVASYYIVFHFISEKNEITVSRGTFTLDDGINAENIKQYRFANSGYSVKHLYQLWCEPVPKDEFDIITHGYNYYFEERETVSTVFTRLHVVPAMIVLILIPFFFGRIFSDGTIKNFIACGHSKRQIYLASLLFSFFLNIALILVTLILFAFICLYFKWLPPIYLPLMLVMLLLEVTISCVLSSVCLAVLFSSKKEVMAIIASFLLIIPMICLMFDDFGIFSNSDVEELDYYLHPYSDEEAEDYAEFREIVQLEGANAFVHKFDIITFDWQIYYKGRLLKTHNYSSMDPVEMYAWLAKIYMNPYVARRMDSLDLYDYQKYRDGIYAINLANNVIWIFATSALGLFIFKKREFK